MKVNGWGYPVRGHALRVTCPECTATLDFGTEEIWSVRIGRAEVRSIRCPRCRRGINLGRHRPRDPAPGGPAGDRAGG